jgi:hypothetical protein
VKVAAALGLVTLWLLTVGAAVKPPKQSPPPPPPTSAPPPPAPAPAPAGALTPQLNLDPAAGPPATLFTVGGSQFPGNQTITIFWDTRDHLVATARTDPAGKFQVQLAAPEADVGLHTVCVIEGTSPCADFKLQEKPPPAPSESPSPSPVSSLAPRAASRSSAGAGRPLLLDAPFLLFPLLLLLGSAGAAAYWLWVRREVEPALPGAHVRHRSPVPMDKPPDLPRARD